MTARQDPFLRRLGVLCYRGLVKWWAQGVSFAPNQEPRLWYGGVRAGTTGGPALKLDKAIYRLGGSGFAAASSSKIQNLFGCHPKDDGRARLIDMGRLCKVKRPL